MNPPEPEVTAREFTEVLLEWLIPQEMDEVRRRNRLEKEDCCHSHDFCDANMAMLQCKTFRDWMDEEGVNFPTDPMIEQMNKAWAIAKKNEFYIK